MGLVSTWNGVAWIDTLPPGPPLPEEYVQATSVVVEAGPPDFSLGGVTVSATGDLVAVVRHGTDHLTAGNLVQFTSTDDGATWAGPTTIRDTAADMRDADVMTLANDDLLCTFTERTAGGSDFTSWVMRSTDDGATWGSPVRLTNSLTSWDFVTSKIIELTGGNLVCAVYGRNTSDSYDTSVLVRSTNGGTSWSQLAVIKSGPGWSRHASEPYLTILPNDDLLCFLRSDTAPHAIYLTTSTDDGATWAAPVALWSGSGRPAAFYTADGAVVCMYRHTNINTGRAAMRFSFDDALTWSDPVYMAASTAPYVYGSWVDLPSALGVLWAVEPYNGRADVFFDTFTYVP